MLNSAELCKTGTNSALYLVTTHLVLNEDTNRSGAPYVFFSCFFLTGAKKRLLLQALAHAVPAWHMGTAVFSLLRAVRMKEPDSCVQHITSAAATAPCYATLKPGLVCAFTAFSKWLPDEVSHGAFRAPDQR